MEIVFFSKRVRLSDPTDLDSDDSDDDQDSEVSDCLSEGDNGSPVSQPVNSPELNETSIPSDNVDIGELLKTMTLSSIRRLSLEKKYLILTAHFKPGTNYAFPSRKLDGCNRSCQYKYLQENPWFVYSKAEDGLFCLPCVLFRRDNTGQFVTKKFDTWTKKSRKFAVHNHAKNHLFAVEQAENVKTIISKPGVSIDDRLQQTKQSDVLRNREILKSLADAILFCGRQGLALRGHRDDSTADSTSNKGIYMSLLEYSVRSGNEALSRHLKECGKNATYTSKTTQNELIQTIGDYLRNKLLEEVRTAKWFSILCDEVTDVSNKEQVSIVIRFVDVSCNIREEFLEFVTTDRITGEVLANKIKETLVKWGIDFQDCRGQGYDGASNMSAQRGVQGRLAAENSKAVYTHCNSHILNLCIVQACSLQAVRNMNGTVTETAYFF